VQIHRSNIKLSASSAKIDLGTTVSEKGFAKGANLWVMGVGEAAL